MNLNDFLRFRVQKMVVKEQQSVGLLLRFRFQEVGV
jgi:hypothetical protein